MLAFHKLFSKDYSATARSEQVYLWAFFACHCLSCLRQLCYISTACRFLSTAFFIFLKLYFRNSFLPLRLPWVLQQSVVSCGFFCCFLSFDDFAILTDTFTFGKYFFHFFYFIFKEWHSQQLPPFYFTFFLYNVQIMYKTI